MSATPVPAYSAVTTGDTNIAAGVLTFTDAPTAAGFIVGALAWLTDDAGANNVIVRILSVDGTDVTVAFQPFNGGAGLPPQGGGPMPDTHATIVPGMGAGISFTGNYGASNLNSPVPYPTGSTLSQWIQLSNLES